MEMDIPSSSVRIGTNNRRTLLSCLLLLWKYKHRCDEKMILPSSFWNKDRAAAASDSEGSK